MDERSSTDFFSFQKCNHSRIYLFMTLHFLHSSIQSLIKFFFQSWRRGFLSQRKVITGQSWRSCRTCFISPKRLPYVWPTLNISSIIRSVSEFEYNHVFAIYLEFGVWWSRTYLKFDFQYQVFSQHTFCCKSVIHIRKRRPISLSSYLKNPVILDLKFSCLRWIHDETSFSYIILAFRQTGSGKNNCHIVVHSFLDKMFQFSIMWKDVGRERSRNATITKDVMRKQS